MKITQRYKEALDSIDGFTKRHWERLEDYLRDLKQAESYGRPTGEDANDPEKMAAWEREATKRMEEVRLSEKYKHVIDMRDQLVVEQRAARAECIEAADHPLYTDRGRKKRKDQWILELDEKNYDVAAAHTLDDKLRVEQNLRELFNAQAIEKARQDERAQRIMKLRKEQRDRGLQVDPNARIRPIE